MYLALISDTHVGADQVTTLVNSLRERLTKADRILHAGDVVVPELLRALAEIAPVDAVAGNMDGEEITNGWPERGVFRFEGHRVGLIHGWGSPHDLSRRVWERFTGDDNQPEVDVIVFGHSHQPLIEERRGVLMVNPGSPTDRRWAPHRTMGWLELLPDKPPKASIIRIE
ncbi:MAG: metallophosphoesterase family protein [Deltaproteobacteria bacterium]|nr:metallophosphoesterase family protein [Deltaproteobacteria bacterium]